MVRHCPSAFHPVVCGLLSTGAHERDECRGYGVQLAQKRSARDRVKRVSVPARVFRANWYGRVASSSWQTWARLRDTTRRQVSPVPMPRTPSPGLRRAVRRDTATRRLAVCKESSSASASSSNSLLVVFTRGSRQPNSGAAPGSLQSLRDGGVVEHCR